MLTKVIVTFVVLGVVVVIVTWVWKEMTKPRPPAIDPPNLRDPTEVENDLNRMLEDFEDVRQELRDYGSVDGPSCGEAVRLANRIKALLNEYNSLPGKNQATYDRLNADFEALERFLDSWCSDYTASG